MVQSDAPILLGRFHKVSPLSTSVLPRTSRANAGTLNTATAKITLVMPLPRIATMPMASRMPGNANSTSDKPGHDAVPPALVVARQQAQHGADDGADDDREEAARRARCACPARMRLKMSRPSESTPNPVGGGRRRSSARRSRRNSRGRRARCTAPAPQSRTSSSTKAPATMRQVLLAKLAPELRSRAYGRASSASKGGTGCRCVHARYPGGRESFQSCRPLTCSGWAGLISRRARPPPG